MHEQKKYGIIVGRFQPLHRAHELLISEILLDDRTPVVFIGSIDKHDERNPLTYVDRMRIIKEVFPKRIRTFGIKDIGENDEEWFAQIHNHMTFLGAEPKDTPIFFYGKQDDHNWTHEGRKLGYPVRRPQIMDYYNEFDICGSDIRADMENNKMYLHPYTYEYLKMMELLS